ncbi:eCIS core domain-containing protein [Micromonospora sp. SH-82]|uniref:eCIS core domain-containing protein n=1 Tax=Micromonospora sp. SH-82 TaxID=3132938 RepID=UPI003EBED10D
MRVQGSDRGSQRQDRPEQVRSGPTTDREEAAPRATGVDRSPGELLALQRAVGNRAVGLTLQRDRDQHEHGADCGHLPADPVQRTVDPGQRSVDPVQRSVASVLGSAGRPLDDSTRTDMESRLGADFSDVRIHDDAAARESATGVGARAYTSGNHVVIGAGGGDRHTLAHELTHVIQQRLGPVAGTDDGSGLRVSDPGDRFEREAEANAHRALASTPTSATGAATAEPSDAPAPVAAGPTVQRALIAQVTANAEAQVEGLNIVGRPDSPYSGTMGDHTTGFVVHKEALRRAVAGRSATEAAGAIMDLVKTVDALPSQKLVANLEGKHKERFDESRTKLDEQHKEITTGDGGLLSLQSMAETFLQYRELVPLTTIKVNEGSQGLAGKGQGESGHHRVLTNPSATSDQIQQAVLGLLGDLAVTMVATASSAQLPEMAPGLKDESSDERVRLILLQHLKSIEEAYPTALTTAWPGHSPELSEPLAWLTEQLQPKIEARKTADRVHYEEKLKKVDETIQLKLLGTSTQKEKEAVWSEWREQRAELVEGLERNGGTAPAEPTGVLEGRRQRKPASQPSAAEPSARTGAAKSAAKSSKAKSSGASSKAKSTSADPADLVADLEAVKLSAEQDPGGETSAEGGGVAESVEETAAGASSTVDADPIMAETSAAPVASRITLEGELIKGYESAGRPPSPFPGGTMGAHTTAWTVYLDLVRAKVVGKSVPDAAAGIDSLFAEAVGTYVDRQDKFGESGPLKELVRETRDRLEEAVSDAKEATGQLAAIRLQTAINELLTLWNYIPGATLESADTGGKGEGTTRKALLAHEQDGKLTPSQAENHLWQLLDLNVVDNEDDQKMLVEHHYDLVSVAYPKSVETARLKKDPDKLLARWKKFVSGKST